MIKLITVAKMSVLHVFIMVEVLSIFRNKKWYLMPSNACFTKHVEVWLSYFCKVWNHSKCLVWVWANAISIIQNTKEVLLDLKCNENSSANIKNNSLYSAIVLYLV